MSDNIELETKPVGKITGKFFVPSYQRGYRWGKDEVERLLDDVYQNGKKTYCLQPVVVRKRPNDYELVDGQQRLTTLYLIYKYMRDRGGSGASEFPAFSLSYETRPGSADFLRRIDPERWGENIDFWFMANAYETIKRWFGRDERDRQTKIRNMSGYFAENVKIIWYEVGEDEDPILLFSRLNIGKIPLTSAELVKAMFLSRHDAGTDDVEKQAEIALQWDNIEKELHNDSLWCFLTNPADNRYQTRIDLVLDLIAEKPKKSSESYHTFFEFEKRRRQNSLAEVWKEIQHTFLILKDWFEDHELYHKIGYLIASSDFSLQDIYGLSKNKTRTGFKAALDESIRKRVKIAESYSDLSYERAGDCKKIQKLLLLFNVESVRRLDDRAQRFPFDKFKIDKAKRDKVVWSLEHIHAQQSEGLKNKKEAWKEWLKLHIPSVEAVDDKKCFVELIAKMRTACGENGLTFEEFEPIQQEVWSILSLPGNVEHMHSIANLALLKAEDNAALNNSTFDVKRTKIVEMDKEGQYIPYCTKMIFLKYYTPSEKNQLHFWGPADRKAYIDAINETLKDYLEKPIALEKEAS